MILAVLVAAATAIAAAAPPAPRPPDGTYVYTVTLRGTVIGTTSIAVGPEGPGIAVKESATFGAPIVVTAATTTHYDAALHETGYSGDFTLSNGKQHTDVTVKPGNVRVNEPGQSIDLAADRAAPLELADDHLLALHTMLPAIVHATGAETFSLAVLAAGQTVVAKVVDAAAPAPPVSAKAGDATLTIDVAGVRVTYWYDPASYVVHAVAIPVQSVEFRLN
jgi:hypothetical protein